MGGREGKTSLHGCLERSALRVPPGDCPLLPSRANWGSVRVCWPPGRAVLGMGVEKSVVGPSAPAAICSHGGSEWGRLPWGSRGAAGCACEGFADGAASAACPQEEMTSALATMRVDYEQIKIKKIEDSSNPLLMKRRKKANPTEPAALPH